MKIATFAASLLTLGASAAAAAGLKGSVQRKLAPGDPGDLNGAVFANTHAPPGVDRQDGGFQFPTPSLEDLEAVYDGFCDICTLASFVNADQIFCILCSFDLDGDDVDGQDPDQLDIPSCFSEVSTVQVESVGQVAMKDLSLGARVLTQSGAYEPVYAFGHKNPTKPAYFFQFKTSAAATDLEMTGGHLVFLKGKSNPVRADSVKVGDILQGQDTTANKVLGIQRIHREGVYSPLTPSGTVVVGGIVASSYISLQKDANEFVQLQGGISTFLSWQDFVHLTLSPFRMLSLGVSSGLGNAYTEEGVPLYASYGMDLLQWLNQQNIVVQFVALVVAFGVFGTSMILENAFGASWAPFVCGGAVALWKCRSNTCSNNRIKAV